MKIPIESWKLYDWQGPSSGVRLRITADDAFLARDDNDAGFAVDPAPKVFREVDCTVGSEVVNGLTVKTITIPALWLFSTTDAIVNRTARYTAKFVTTRGADIKPLDLLQSFILHKSLLDVFNPVPWKEIIRANYPAAPIPIDKTTFSVEQILELIGGGAISGGPNGSNKRIAFWGSPVMIDGAIGFEWQTIDGNVPALSLLPPTPSTFNGFRIAEGAGNANVKVGGVPALFSTHLTDESGINHRALSNDAATRRWVEKVRDGALGLQYSAYNNSDALQSNTIFDPAGGIGFSDASAEHAYFYKASSAYHLGINAAGPGASGATKEITFTLSGVGINKFASIGSQLHVVSGDTARVGFIVDSASGPSQPLAILRNNTSQRFLFDHNANAEFGLQSVVKGRLTFAVANNTNKQSIEGADTPASNIVYKLPASDPTNGQLLRTLSFGGGVAVLEWVNPSAGGDVSSSIGSVIDNKLTRFDGTSGKLIQDSAVVVEDTTGSFVVPNTWALKDANGNEVITITSQASAVNEWNFSNAPTGQPVVVAPTGSDASISMRFSPKGTNGLNEFTKNMLMNVGPNALDNVVFVNSASAGAVNASFGFMVAGVGSGTATDGPYFFARGNNWAGFGSDQKGSMLFVAGNITSPTGNQGKIRFMTGNEVERFTIAPDGSPSVFTTNVNITKGTAPQLRLAQTSGTAKNFVAVINGSGELVIGEDGVTNAITVAHTSGVTTFSAIPILPASNPTTANQAVRKQWIDDMTFGWSMAFFEPDPATGTFSVEDRPFGLVPEGTNWKLTKLKIYRMQGSHTSGGTLTFTFRKRGPSGDTDVGSVTMDNTNNAANTVYTNDIADVTLSPGDRITYYISTRSGTITETFVALWAEGFRGHI